MMKRSAVLLRWKLFAFSILIFLIPVPAFYPAAAAVDAQITDDPPTEVILDNGFKIGFLGVDYDNGDDTSTWRYTVEELPDSKDLDHWVLELPYCIELVDASPESWELVDPDPNTRLSGIRWDIEDEFEEGNFTVIIDGQWDIGETEVAAKGPDMAWGVIAGPSCDENLPPSAVDDATTTYADQEVSIPVLENDSDPNSDVVILEDYDAVSAEGGTVSRDDRGTEDDLSDDTLVYTPPSGFTGEDSFSYTAGDGTLVDQAQVVITVNPGASLAIANTDTYLVDETPYTVPPPGILENDVLILGETAQVTLDSEPNHGTLEMNGGGSFTYTSDTGFFGEDAFSYYLDNGLLPSNTAEVALQVLDVTKPTLVWMEPVPDGEVMVVEPGETVVLVVQAEDNDSIDRVEFIRWDPIIEDYIFINSDSRDPYTAEIEASDLLTGFNQVNAVVYDDSGNRSDFEHIWLYKQGEFAVYLPLTAR